MLKSLFYFILFYFILFYFILFYFILFYTFAFSILNLNSKPKIQMKQTFNFLLMLVIIATVLSCKKSEPAPELTPAQKIVGKYKRTAATSSSGGVSRDLLATRPACAADDVTEFMADGKVLNSEGASSCTPARVTTTDAYTLSADGKTLTLPIIANGITVSAAFTVEELTVSVLRCYTIFTDPTGAPNGTSITVRSDFTLTKI